MNHTRALRNVPTFKTFSPLCYNFRVTLQWFSVLPIGAALTPKCVGWVIISSNFLPLPSPFLLEKSPIANTQYFEALLISFQPFFSLDLQIRSSVFKFTEIFLLPCQTYQWGISAEFSFLYSNSSTTEFLFGLSEIISSSL